MKRLIILSLVVLAGCTDRMAAWTGRPVDELVAKWGVPDGRMELKDGREVITYISSWTSNRHIYSSGAVAGRNKMCKKTFMIDPNGTIVDWSKTGCGRFNL